MLDLFNTPTPLNCNFQEFYYQGTNTTGRNARWVKPRGCSMVRFLAIGGGGGGGANSTLGGGGGGSAGITSLLIPAIFVPDNILVQVGAGGAGANQTSTSNNGSNGNDTILSAFFTSGTVVQLLIGQNGVGANSSTGGSGATAETVNYFSAAGILQSVAGQAGANARGNITATATIPLTGGSGGMDETNGRTVTPNYGYPAIRNADGYFQLTPILLGCGGGGGGSAAAGGAGGIGCGGGGGGYNGTTGFAGGRGGNGAVFIWAW